MMFTESFYPRERENNRLFPRPCLNLAFPPDGFMLPAEEVGGGEVTEAMATFLLNPAPSRNVALVPGLQRDCRGGRGPEPACLLSWG